MISKLTSAFSTTKLAHGPLFLRLYADVFETLGGTEIVEVPNCKPVEVDPATVQLVQHADGLALTLPSTTWHFSQPAEVGGVALTDEHETVLACWTRPSKAVLHAGDSITADFGVPIPKPKPLTGFVMPNIAKPFPKFAMFGDGASEKTLTPSHEGFMCPRCLCVGEYVPVAQIVGLPARKCTECGTHALVLQDVGNEHAGGGALVFADGVSIKPRAYVESFSGAFGYLVDPFALDLTVRMAQPDMGVFPTPASIGTAVVLRTPTAELRGEVSARRDTKFGRVLWLHLRELVPLVTKPKDFQLVYGITTSTLAHGKQVWNLTFNRAALLAFLKHFGLPDFEQQVDDLAEMGAQTDPTFLNSQEKTVALSHLVTGYLKMGGLSPTSLAKFGVQVQLKA